MATKAKAKPKAAASKKTAAKKAPAKKATKTQAKPKKPEVLIEEGALVQFLGYKGEIEADERVFTEDDILQIIEHDTSNKDGVLYTCIKADDIAEYEENGDENVTGGQVATFEVKELKGKALVVAQEQFVPIHNIGRMDELLEEQDGDPVSAAIALEQDIQEAYFYMGGMLAKTLQGGLHLKENGGEFSGDTAFNDFCQTHLGFKESKGRQLARIYVTFSALPDFDPASHLEGIQWSIANKVEKYVTADNYEEVLDVARSDEVTQRTVDAVMRDNFTDASGQTASGKASSRGGDKLLTRTVSYRLTEDSAESVELAIQAAMKQMGLEKPELALEAICVQWAQDHIETERTKKSIAAKAKKGAAAREKHAAPAKAAKAPAKPPAKGKTTRKKAA